MTDIAPLPRRVSADAGDTLTDLDLIALLTPTQRENLVLIAFEILRDARTARLGPRPAPTGPATVTYVTQAEFRAGRAAPHRRPRLIVVPAGSTPGDAA